jgi:hypothetical protein
VTPATLDRNPEQGTAYARPTSPRPVACPHAARNLRHRAVPHPDSAGHLADAVSGDERSPYSSDLRRWHLPGCPIAFPLLVPCARALAMAARTRSTIIARSNSPNTLNPCAMNLIEKADEVLQGAPQARYRTSGYDVELVASYGLHNWSKAGRWSRPLAPLIPFVHKLRNDAPTVPFCGCGEVMGLWVFLDSTHCCATADKPHSAAARCRWLAVLLGLWHRTQLHRVGCPRHTTDPACWLVGRCSDLCFAHLQR